MNNLLSFCLILDMLLIKYYSPVFVYFNMGDLVKVPYHLLVLNVCVKLIVKNE